MLLDGRQIVNRALDKAISAQEGPFQNHVRRETLVRVCRGTNGLPTQHSAYADFNNMLDIQDEVVALPKPHQPRIVFVVVSISGMTVAV
jgi:hypothetical protein